MSDPCVVNVVVESAKVFQIKVQQQAAAKITVQEPVTKIIRVLEGPAGAAGTSRTTKAGVISGGSFSGTPKKYAVLFTTPFADATYVLAVTSTDSRLWTYESKAASGFTLNANAGAALVGEVSWTAMVSGET